MRQAFAQEAVLLMEPHADVRAPGAAVTVALCGHWEHEPPCPLAPHHVSADEGDGELRVRILFAVEPDKEGEVRRLIEQALSGPVRAGEVPGRLRRCMAAARNLAQLDLGRRGRPRREPDSKLSVRCPRYLIPGSLAVASANARG